MSELRDRLRPVFDSVVVLSPSAAVVNGLPVRSVPTAPVDGMPDPLLVPLASAIYGAWYCAVPPDHAGTTHAPGENGEFLRTLQSANTTRPRWEDRWRLEEVLPTGYVVVARDGYFRTCSPGEFVLDQPDGGWVPGRTGRVLFAKDSALLQPGMYFVFGEEASERPEHTGLLRWYWSIEARAAAELIGRLTASLNAYRVPFRLKCPARSGGFERLDALVMFVHGCHYTVVADQCLPIAAALHPHLRAGSLLFTKRMTTGLALAEDPLDGDSFGFSRCRILAQAVLESHREGGDDEPARWRAFERIFTARGFRVDRPYLNPASMDRYVWPPASRTEIP